MFEEIEFSKKEKYSKGEIVVWNKLKRWGDEDDSLFKIDFGVYNSQKGEINYSGVLLKEIKVKSKGIENILIPFRKVIDIPENEIISFEGYLNLVGRKGVENEFENI